MASYLIRKQYFSYLYTSHLTKVGQNKMFGLPTFFFCIYYDYIIQPGETTCNYFQLSYFLFDCFGPADLKQILSGSYQLFCFPFICFITFLNWFLLSAVYVLLWFFIFQKQLSGSQLWKEWNNLYLFLMFQTLPPTVLPLHQAVKLFTLIPRLTSTVFRKMVFLLKASRLGWTGNHDLLLTAYFVLLLMTLWGWMRSICWSWSSNSNKDIMFWLGVKPVTHSSPTVSL